MLYPLAGRPQNPDIAYGHHEIAWALLGHGEVGPDVLTHLSTEIFATDAHTIILSSEEFDRLNDAQVAKLASFFPAETQVVMFYRRQSDIVQGLYGTEIVSIGNQDSIEAFIAGFTSELHFDRLAQRWAAHVGAGNVLARAYDRRTFPDGDIVPAFLDLIGLGGYRPLPEGPNFNVSLPWYAARTVQRMWALGWPPSLIQQATYALGRLKGPSANAADFMLPSAVAAFDASFAESNAAFQAAFAADQPAIVPAPPRSDADWLAAHREPYGDLRLLTETLTEALQQLP